MADRPVAVLAFSYDPQRTLNGVHEELLKLEPMLKRDTAFFVEAQWKPTAQWIEDTFGKFSNPDYGDQIHLFHFSGHATSNTQQWNDDDDFEDAVDIFAGPLAEFIGIRCKNIKLVFLNACCTQAQVDFFIQKGAQAVIATTRPVGDQLATAFAVKFYSFFIDPVKRYNLRQAFDLAWQRMNFTDEFLLRSTLDLEEPLEANKNLYELHLNPHGHKATIEGATFDQWSKIQSKANTVPLAEDPAKSESKGVHPSAYLLCNRDEQHKTMVDLLVAKRNNQLTKPCFVAIHDEEKHCPQFVAEWLDWYGLNLALATDPSAAPTKVSRYPSCFKTLRELSPEAFRDKGDWSDPNNPARDLFKHELFHLYRERFEGYNDTGNTLQALSHHLPEQFPLLVAHHTLDFEAWEENTTLQNNLKTLLDFYLGDFSLRVLQPFSPRLLVLLSVKYWNGCRSQWFTDLFDTLAQGNTEQHPSTFYNIFKFNTIKGGDLNKWQQRNLGDSAFFEVGSILQKENPLSMFTAKKELALQIDLYNRQFEHHGR